MLNRILKKSRFALLLSAALTLSQLSPAAFGMPVEETEQAEIQEEDAAGSDTAAVLSEGMEQLSSLEAGEDYVPNEGVAEAASLEEAEKLAEQYGGELKNYQAGIAVLSFDREIGEVLYEASMDPRIEEPIYPNLLMELYREKTSLSDYNDPRIGYQWFHEYIDDVHAWNITRGKGAVVAVLDTGCVLNHADLQNQILSSNFIDPSVTDASDYSKGHGTHVSGIVAAEQDNGIGVSGVAPEAGLYIVKMNTKSSESIPVDHVWKAVNMAVEKRVHVINLSVGIPASDLGNGTLRGRLDKALEAAFQAGITVVAAAGNSAVDDEMYPACSEYVISVGSCAKDGTLSYFSNYGDWVDLVAPGGGGSGSNEDTYIYSTSTRSDGYVGMRGTSQASPMAAGVAALVYSSDETLLNAHNASAAQYVRDRLLSTTDGKRYGYQGHYVRGCLNAFQAVCNYRFREKSGYLTDSSQQKIAIGKTIRLQIANAGGTVVKEAKKKKNVTWSMTNTKDFSLKNGRLKCLKTASPGAETVVSAVFNGSVISANFIAHEKTVRLGYLTRKQSGAYGAKTSVTLDRKLGETISVSQIDALTGQEIRAFAVKPKKTSPGKSVSADEIGYSLKVNKQKKLSITSWGDNGNLKEFIPMKRGKYTLTCTAADGTNKKFRIRIRVQ